MVNMKKQRILTAIMGLVMCLPMLALANDNPFDKGESVTIGSGNAWVVKDKTATRSGAYGDSFYHLFYDRKQLRLRITDGAEDNEVSARQYQQFAVEDVRVDGKRLPLFQWCLGNQQRHSRFLQQGLKVKQDVCNNRGEKGTFIMRLNAATLDTLKKGQTLSFKLKPFRTSLNVNFDISDFTDVIAKLSTRVKLVQQPQAPIPEIDLDKVVAFEKCKAEPPKDFATITPIEYVCDDVTAKAEAEASIGALVAKERKLKIQLAAERERKLKQAAEAKKAKEEADKKAAEEAAAKLAEEQAALAAAEASKKEMNAEITNKMLAVCQKKWAKGEHRCYCEKFIAHAPAGIESDPSCAAE
jgi:hypothetical protein